MKRKLISQLLRCTIIAGTLIMGMQGPLHSSFSTFAAPPSISQSDLEAAFIIQLTKYIEWPNSALNMNNKDTPFILSIVGDSPLVQSLTRLSKTKTINDHRIQLEVLESPEALKTSHLVVLIGDDPDGSTQVLKKVKNTGTLTVSHAAGFGKKGMIINFFTENNKLRFEINVTHAKAAGLSISSQLLKLARLVEEQK